MTTLTWTRLDPCPDCRRKVTDWVGPTGADDPATSTVQALPCRHLVPPEQLGMRRGHDQLLDGVLSGGAR